MKTPVQELFDEMVNLGFIENPDDLLLQERLKSILKDEKQEIMDAHKAGRMDRHDDCARDGQKYYEQTFTQELD